MRYAIREGLCAIIGLLYMYVNVVVHAYYQGDCMHREPQQIYYVIAKCGYAVWTSSVNTLIKREEGKNLYCAIDNAACVILMSSTCLPTQSLQTYELASKADSHPKLNFKSLPVALIHIHVGQRRFSWITQQITLYTHALWAKQGSQTLRYCWTSMTSFLLPESEYSYSGPKTSLFA